MKHLKHVTLAGRFRPTGKTRHSIGSAKAPVPSSLSIGQMPDDPGYYLLYLDEGGHEITDTYHETLQSALEQASWEFEVPETAWIDMEAH